MGALLRTWPKALAAVKQNLAGKNPTFSNETAHILHSRRNFNRLKRPTCACSMHFSYACSEHLFNAYAYHMVFVGSNLLLDCGPQRPRPSGSTLNLPCRALERTFGSQRQRNRMHSAGLLLPSNVTMWFDAGLDMVCNDEYSTSYINIACWPRLKSATKRSCSTAQHICILYNSKKPNARPICSRSHGRDTNKQMHSHSDSVSAKNSTYPVWNLEGDPVVAFASAQSTLLPRVGPICTS